MAPSLGRRAALLGAALIVGLSSGGGCGGGFGTEVSSPEGEGRLTVKPVPSTESEPFEHPATVSVERVRELLTRETPRVRYAAEAVALELAKAGPQHVIGLCEWKEGECFVDLKLYVRAGELHYVGRDIYDGSRMVGGSIALRGTANPAPSAKAWSGAGCSSDGDCKAGRVCHQGKCVEGRADGCSSNVDCKGTRVCHLGHCVASGPVASSAPSAAAPPNDSPAVMPAGDSCSSDAHCKGTRVCRRGHCVQP